jgi:hypothetical protein
VRVQDVLDDPCVQRLFDAVDQTQTLTQLILPVWPLACFLAMHIIESVLAERALRPTFWPRCATCGAYFHRQGFVKRQVPSPFGPIRWRRGVGRCPQAVTLSPWRLWMKHWGCNPISVPVRNGKPWAVPSRSLYCLLLQHGC